MKTKSILISTDNDRPHRNNPLLGSLGSLQSREGVLLRFPYFLSYMLPHHAMLTFPLCLSLLLLTPFTCLMHSHLMHSLCLTHVLLITINHALPICHSGCAYCTHSFPPSFLLITRYPGCYHASIFFSIYA